MKLPKFLLFVLFSVPVLTCAAGCVSSAPVPAAGGLLPVDAAPVVEQQNVSLSLPDQPLSPPDDYVVGPGDVLSVSVYGRADLSTSGEQGHRVDGSGDIQVPLAGSIHVAGLTAGQVRARIQSSLETYLKEPSVVIEILDHKSQPIYLLGQFKVPGTHYLDRPVNILQGLALGNGLDPSANLRGARLLRQRKIMPVDIYALLHDGDQLQNIWLKPGDIIFVPDNSLQNVFVFGAVKVPGPIAMKNGQLTLHQAVAAAGGLGDTGYDRNIRIIRSLSPTKGQLMVVDLDRILLGEVRPFQLMDGDIVYVPKSAIANWNQAINEILPTLQVIGAILNPFVQIKFLSDSR